MTGRSDEIELRSVACALCGSDSCVAVLQGQDLRHALPGQFQIVRCRDCRHVYMNPSPTPETIGRCYPTDYAPHRAETNVADEPAEKTDPPPSPWYLSSWARRIPGLRRLYYWLADHRGEFIPKISEKPRRGLELGCATGRFLMKLRDEGWEAMGVEPAEMPAKTATDRGFPIHVGSLESANFPAETFAGVFAWHVIEHLVDPKGTLDEIHRILEPGGWLAFSLPNYGCWERWCFGRFWYGLDLPRHLHHFTPRTLRKVLSDTGFEQVTIVHQRNLLNVITSLGLMLQQWFPRRELGRRLIEFSDHPTMWCQLALAPLAKLLAFLRQGGRLTIIARKAPSSSSMP